MALLIQYTLIFASVLMLVALGGCFSEHSGIINIGLEGIMVIGAMGGALMMRYLPDGTSAPVMIVMVCLAAVLAGAVYSMLLAVAAINFNADQTIIGTAMNMLGTALATVVVKALNMAADPNNVSSTIEYVDQKKAFYFNIGSLELSWFMIIAVVLLVVSHVVLYKTRFGLRLCACGEHPQAADSVGINVYKMRYAGVLISGILGGLGGIVYITSGVSEWKFENGVAGFGFLALAVMIFGQWKPMNIALAAILFGLMRALSNVYVAFDFLAGLNIPGTVYNMLPYIISLVVLIFTSKKSRAPKAEGIPYDKGSR
ncbi:MAG: ABC transporter permease [Oscillospiraceae bacterium]|nr:ABC transporter permease [Oscillospiraceae bacterium]